MRKKNLFINKSNDIYKLKEKISNPNLIRNKFILYFKLANDFWLYFLFKGYQCLNIFYVGDQYEKHCNLNDILYLYLK